MIFLTFSFFTLHASLMSLLMFSVHHIPSTGKADVIWRMFEGMLLPHYFNKIRTCCLLQSAVWFGSLIKWIGSFGLCVTSPPFWWRKTKPNLTKCARSVWFIFVVSSDQAYIGIRILLWFTTLYNISTTLLQNPLHFIYNIKNTLLCVNYSFNSIRYFYFF